MSNGDIIYVWGLASRGLPNVQSADGVQGPIRTGRYGEVYTQPLYGSKLVPVSDEGSYFVATNPTPGTGIAAPAAPGSTPDDTKPTLLIVNGSTTKELVLDYLRLQATAAGTNGTNFGVVMKTDIGPSRYTSGGSAITPVCPNANSSNTSNATVKFGAITAASATSSARLVWNGLLRSVIKVIGDTYTFSFGDSDSKAPGMISEGTAQYHPVIKCPPVILGPGQQLLVHDYAASQTVGASWEFNLGWWER
jgi:hypothetical protein